ncbi:Hypothetical protein CINCED_3A009060 [Cinara cedri]|uniref:Cysteine alpha-hairpin motif superfamily n=1 Tax=Cinara cedri TaxID=506608 RepID=A0A5E4MTP3_9HEMI|nr:Hypothetical protein CINCED_3A009060 [Cinara cedri]
MFDDPTKTQVPQVPQDQSTQVSQAQPTQLKQSELFIETTSNADVFPTSGSVIRFIDYTVFVLIGAKKPLDQLTQTTSTILNKEKCTCAIHKLLNCAKNNDDVESCSELVEIIARCRKAYGRDSV